MTDRVRPDGGIVLSDYGDNEAINVLDPETQPHMYDRFSEWAEKVYGCPLSALPEEVAVG
ncbi:MAG: hypothetical protein GVY16_02650 [Planctomycetes bacterium]|nr:hypothetical protein [Phycisphaerae bacterium]NBB94618.1 hypothetical protein [Planctomycetota bacterium]